MPKSQNIDPKVVRKPQYIEFGKIPVNQYHKTIEEENEKKGLTFARGLRSILRHDPDKIHRPQRSIPYLRNLEPGQNPPPLPAGGDGYRWE